ncbi:alpha-1,2-fucosyltransferase [Mucilaginibacter sp. FT3.2]|uniref:alpha-1,2-fucosyltransferase n=1 Tax=Mucilaginibacter sp. FT3.2 TaxID=2723090 RepID=UPI001611BF8B|nr:alpha-1,2-fucosyltransferase [Mucilaginibacter sp. FT3.2]MBB6231296.1 hypothetical protein [Mucilaginibacter sp. FT3.2]
MIIVKLQGGLGNQMFQYAAARSISGNSPVYFDTAFLNSHTQSTSTFTARNLELSVFNNIPFLEVAKFTKHLLEGKKTIHRYLKRIFLPQGRFIYQTEKNELIDLSKIKSSLVYLDGYFQSEEYLKSISGQLLHDFKFPSLTGESKAIDDKIAAADNAVSIHVRRGDYLKPEINAYHGLLSLSYYQAAQKKVEAQVVRPSYFIFSDDPEWCQANLSFFGDNATIISKTGDNNWEDMYLMSRCRHHIIANSSYSWWGAWLNNNPQKIVIAPNNWFTSVNTDIVPAQWTKI